MKGRFIDLHSHSFVSDGADSPSEVVRKAAEAGLAALALTDHDALDGLEEAEEAAGRHGIRFIRGCELSVHDKDESELHLLGLWIPKETTTLEADLQSIREHRHKRNEKILEKLAAIDMPLAMEEVLSFSRGVSPGRPHIALAMVSRRYARSVGEAFDLYIGDGCTAFVPRTLLSPEQGIRLLSSAGATVALAHPFLHDGMTEERLDGLLRNFCAWGLGALEAYHSAHSDRAVYLCVKLAERHGLLLTGGSDYHGSIKPGVRLGAGRGGMRVPLWVLERLEQRRKEQGLWV